MFKARMEQSQSKVNLTEAEFDHAATVLGISSVKYFDLHINRTSDYVFSFDKMLNPDGNTGTFLIYGFVRINSIMRKSAYGNEEGLAKILSEGHTFEITHEKERELALTILRLPEQLTLATNELKVNALTDMLYDITTKIGEFVSNKECRVLGSEQEMSRILLLHATIKTMKVCFDLLGMETIDKI